MARRDHPARRSGLPGRLGPARPGRYSDPVLTYQSILRRIDHWFDAGARAALPVVVPCRSGCSACCHGPFDISAADARLVSEALAMLPAREAGAVRLRAAHQLEAGTRAVPEWQKPWHVADLPEDGFDAMCDALEREPCPALDPATGACLIHANRPATCRLMGLSVRTREGDVLENPCPIQDQFPGYADLPASPLDLMEFEVDAAQHDLAAMAEGWHSTTVAGAILRAS